YGLRLPRRGLPVDGRPRARAPRPGAPRRRFSRHHRRRPVHARAGVLPRQLRLLARSHGRRDRLRPRVAGAVRRDPCRAGGVMTRIYVPADTTARSLGADRVAAAIAAEAKARGVDVEVVRNGSFGLYWLEPLVEVEANGTRLAYGPVTPGDVPGLFDAGFTAGGSHRLLQGPTREIPYLAKQTRLTFARVGLTEPLSLD